MNSGVPKEPCTGWRPGSPQGKWAISVHVSASCEVREYPAWAEVIHYVAATMRPVAVSTAATCLANFHVVAFSTEPRDWLRRTSPKWPILWRKTLLQFQSNSTLWGVQTWSWWRRSRRRTQSTGWQYSTRSCTCCASVSPTSSTSTTPR